jgi:hypothetical protein
MPFLLQIGHSTAKQINDEVGHIACTLGGVNYESRGSRGVVVGGSARGATDELFRQQFFMVLSDRAAHRALRYANLCVGQPYDFGRVPTRNHGGDCSGLISGILCRAQGKPLGRLFSTATWLHQFDNFGFTEGLGGGRITSDHISKIGRLDRPFPLGHGKSFGLHNEGNNVKWIQSRLNFAGRGLDILPGGHALVESGVYDAATRSAVSKFEAQTVRTVSGRVGRVAWNRLNSMR